MKRQNNNGQRTPQAISSAADRLHAMREHLPIHKTNTTTNTPATSANGDSDQRIAASETASASGRENAHGGTGQARPAKKRPNFITRTVNAWIDRVLGAAKSGQFNDQEEIYAANCTKRDYVCNSIGNTLWGFAFPVLTIVATQFCGVEQAGMFSMAFVIASLLMILANYGVRTYQISDLEEVHSFADYQVNRIITCVLMLIVGFIYCTVRGYDTAMFTMCMGLLFYKMVDGAADVYEGRLQQMGKLYLAGISQGLRSFAVLAVATVTIILTSNLSIAAVGMAASSLVTLVIVTIPLAYFETPKSRRVDSASVVELFKQGWPLFFSLFLFALIDNMPKFVMEGMLPYDYQLYFNALYFPATMVLGVAQLIYKPLLVRMADFWIDETKRRKFSLMIVAVSVAIVAITVLTVLFMRWAGLPLMSLLYGVDFEQFRRLCYVMLAAGGLTAGIDFLYQTVVILRRQREIMIAYLITFAFALVFPFLLIGFTQFPGAVISYLIVMSILFVLLLWIYARIRLGMAKDVAAPAPGENARSARDRANRASASHRSQHAQNEHADQAVHANVPQSSRAYRVQKNMEGEPASASPGGSNAGGNGSASTSVNDKAPRMSHAAAPRAQGGNGQNARGHQDAPEQRMTRTLGSKQNAQQRTVQQAHPARESRSERAGRRNENYRS